jgi:UDP-2,4-diacetamido-2,4,6-trideoxy-beta-L-altropyranose hydrolase
MHFAFRTDASLQIGTGHVMRCLTLADALHDRGAQSTFICRPHAGQLLNFIRHRGHTAIEIGPADVSFNAPAKPKHSQWLGTDWSRDAEQTKQALGDQVVDWLVGDHYALDYRWEQEIAPYCVKLMVIDDLADRSHVCDLLLDQTFERDSIIYRTLVPADCRLLCGSEYALLRPEFAAFRGRSLQHRVKPSLKNLIVNMGGVDKDNATGQVLDALRNCPLPAECHITVVMGATAPWLEDVIARARNLKCPYTVVVGVNGDMAKLMANSDLAIGAAGATAWERCCLGLPTIILVLAENQRKIAEGLAQAGAAIVINVESLDNMLPTLVKTLSENPNILSFMSGSASRIVDGTGTNAVISFLINEFG